MTPDPFKIPSPELKSSLNTAEVAANEHGKVPEKPEAIKADEPTLLARKTALQATLTAMPPNEANTKEAEGQIQHLINLDEQGQLNHLTKLALARTPLIAVKAAEGLNDPSVLDKLHDYLVRDDVYPHLKL